MKELTVLGVDAFFALANSVPLYLIVGGILLFIAVMCVVFTVKSYRAGLAIGMDKKVLKRTITSSVTFTILPSVSILLGVIALSGSLGIPISWLRLSVVGALQYELNVAEIAATNIGMSGLVAAEMTSSSFPTIVLVMTAGILGGCLCSIFLLKPYLKRMGGKPGSKPAKDGKPKAAPHPKAKPFGSVAIAAMFIGLCSAYIAAYIGEAVNFGQWLPLFTALVSAAVMAVFEFITIKFKKEWLDNFSVATSMLVAMAAAVFVNMAV